MTLQVWGLDTTSDIPRHVAGATELFKVRYVRSNRRLIARPFDHLIAESILYQEFLLSAADPFSPDIEPDSEFWAWAMDELQCPNFPEASNSVNSPVLGVPISLQILILKIIQLGRGSLPLRSKKEAARLRMETNLWEAAIDGLYPENGTLGLPGEDPLAGDAYHDVTTLYILAASLLLDSATMSMPDLQNDIMNLPGTTSPRQVRKAMQVLQGMNNSDPCIHTFLGNWPLLILGCAVVNEEDMALVKQELDRRWALSMSGETKRTLDKLQSVWRRRKLNMLSTVQSPWLDV